MNDDKKKAVRVNITMPAEIVDQMDEEIAHLGMTRSTYISMAVRSRLNSEKMIRDMPGIMAQASEMVAMLRTLEGKGLLDQKNPSE